MIWLSEWSDWYIYEKCNLCFYIYIFRKYVHKQDNDL